MKSRALERKDSEKSEGRRTAPSRKTKYASRRLSDLLREEAKAPQKGVADRPAPPVRQSDLVRENGPTAQQDGTAAKDGRLKSGQPPSQEVAIEHPVIVRRGTSKRPRWEDLDASEQVFQESIDTMGGILKAIRAHSSFSISLAQQVAQLLLENLQRSDALLVPVFTGGTPSVDPPREAVHVCILAVKFALELGYTQDQLRQLSLAALLHDVGMARLPEELVEKNGPLNPVERASLARHPEEGAQIIRRLGPEYTWLSEVVLQVHERVDGSGYPNALNGLEVQEYAQIIGLADVYESLVCDRPLTPVEALKEILHRERAGFPDRILKALIQALSPYPVGSLVRLNTGEIGRVVARNEVHPLRPVVEVLIRGGKELQEPVMIDLSQSPLLNVKDSVLEKSLS